MPEENNSLTKKEKSEEKKNCFGKFKFLWKYKENNRQIETFYIDLGPGKGILLLNIIDNKPITTTLDLTIRELLGI